MEISLLDILSNPAGNFRIPVYNPSGETLAEQNGAILLSSLVGGGGGYTNFAAYDPETEYNNDLPDFVSYNGNVYEYINVTPASGKTPNTQPLYWKLASIGQFAHQQNTDAGTNKPSFIIQRNSQNQDPDGETLLIFEGIQGGVKGALRYLWDSVAGKYTFEVCNNYTGTGSDIWDRIGNEPGVTTGTALTFTSPRFYGSIGTPETGNITASLTGAKLGIINQMFHNSGTEPTLGGLAIGNNSGVFHQVSGSGEYELGATNCIMFDLVSISPARINYSIIQ